MGSLVLTVGTGSTWAMRASLVLAMSGLEWQEQVFDLEDAKALQRLKRTAPAGLVPWLDDGELRIHDSLAIAEYLHELCPAGAAKLVTLPAISISKVPGAVRKAVISISFFGA